MKITYELELADQDYPLYTERAAELMSAAAECLRDECIGKIVSTIGWTLSVEDVGSIRLMEIEP